MTSTGEHDARTTPANKISVPLPEVRSGGARTYKRLWAMQYLAGYAIAIALYGMVIHSDAFTGLAQGSVVLLAIAFSLTFFAFTPMAAIAGRLVERWGPQRTLLASNLGYLGLMVIALVTLTVGYVSPWLGIALLMGRTGSQAVQLVALESSVPALFPQRDLTRANGSRLFFTASLAAFEVLLAQVLYPITGVLALVVVTCLVLGVSIVGVNRADIPPIGAQPANDLRPDQPTEDSLRALLRRRPGLIVVLAAFALFNFTFGFGEVSNRTITESLGTTATTSVVLGIGFVFLLGSTILLTLRGAPRGHVRWLRVSFMVLGGSLVVAGARPNLVLVTVSVVVFLAIAPVIMALISTLLHVNADPHLMGRMMGVKTAIIGLFYGGGNVIAVLSSAISEPLAGGPEVADGFLALLVGTGDAVSRGYALLTMLLGLAILAATYALRKHQGLTGLVEPTGDDRSVTAQASAG